MQAINQMLTEQFNGPGLGETGRSFHKKMPVSQEGEK